MLSAPAMSSSSPMSVLNILAAAVPAPTVRPSTEEDMKIAQQRPLFHEDPVIEMAYNLGGAVAIDDNDQVFRAPDDKIVAALAKAATLGVISWVPVEDWLEMHVGNKGVIHTVAQKLIEAQKENVSPGVTAFPTDAETACDILESLLCEQDEYEKVVEENRVFRKYRSVQKEWKEHMSQSFRLEKEKKQLLLEHIEEDNCQKQESMLRQKQLIQQEKLLQERLNSEKHERRAVQLQALEKARADHEEVGRLIKQRGRIIHSDLHGLPGRDGEKRPPTTQHRAFLKAFLQRLQQRQQYQQQHQQKQQVFTGSSGGREEDSMELANPSPSSPKTHSSFFFRSDSGVDAQSLVGAGGASGGGGADFIESKHKGQVLEKEEPVPVRWVWPK